VPCLLYLRPNDYQDEGRRAQQGINEAAEDSAQKPWPLG